jgi:hypothetical protein
LTFEKSWLARLNYVHHNAVKHGLVPLANPAREVNRAFGAGGSSSFHESLGQRPRNVMNCAFGAKPNRGFWRRADRRKVRIQKSSGTLMRSVLSESVVRTA